MKKVLLAMLMLSVYGSIYAQADLTLEEMCSGYARHYVKKEKPFSLDDYDVVIYCYIDLRVDLEKINKDEVYYMQKVKGLQANTETPLPPSIYVAHASSLRDTSDVKVYWKGLRASANAIQEKETRERLKNAYGSVMIGDTIELIPAKWLNGTISTISNPIYHGGFYISTFDPKSLLLAKGENASSGKLIKKHRNKGCAYLDFCDMLYYHRRGNRVTLGNAKSFSEEEIAQEAIHLLSRDLRAVMPKRNNEGVQLYQLILMTDGKGCLHAYDTKPELSGKSDLRRLKELNAALKQLPRNSIGKTCTIDGKTYPGMCVDATYHNGQWWMEIAMSTW